MKIAGWGNYPRVEATCVPFEQTGSVAEMQPFIPRGNGRSYGDSSLSKHIISLKSKNYLLGFDEQSGVLSCEAGAMLDDILQVFIPRGWFFRITPGTKRITLGGAIAADVHGKNHHVEGAFSQCVLDFNLLLPDGSTQLCSPSENAELFKATCGGMGLTGIILEARIRLKKIKSAYIDQTVIRTKNLEDTFDAFEKYKDQPYSVAWIDCLAKGKKRGRAILNVGDHAENGGLAYRDRSLGDVPINLPSLTLNKLTVKLFNTLYYHKAGKGICHNQVGIDSFFYPLDALGNWNKIYGKKGFTQYQFVLPFVNSYNGLEKILSRIAASGKGSFLAVLKLFGEANENWLSFPMRGYTLALDFKIEPGLFPLLKELDKIVVENGGRFYLAKDARVSKTVFEKGYPEIERFRTFRKEHGMDKVIRSLQSDRLGL